MKKILLITVLVLGFISMSNAQVDGSAIGLRLGYGAELSYQQALSSANRLELDLGLNSLDVNAIYLSGVFQWVWDLSALADGFNWYAGAGAAVGIDNGVGVAALGQLGIEYNFNIPLQLSLDWRPALGIVPAIGFGYQGIALGVRYKF